MLVFSQELAPSEPALLSLARDIFWHKDEPTFSHLVTNWCCKRWGHLGRPGFRRTKMYVFVSWVNEWKKEGKRKDGVLLINAFYIHVSTHFYDKSRTGRTTETENRSEVAWNWEVWTGIDYKETQRNFGGDARVLKLDCGEGCTTVWIY